MLEALTFEDLDRREAEYDDDVLESSILDRFCSTSFWILPAARHLSPEARPRIFRSEGAWVVLAQTSHWLHPLEAMWGLPCPLVAGEPEAAVDLLLRALASESTFGAALLTGLVEPSPTWDALRSGLGRSFRTAVGPPTRRYVAEIGDGVPGFLARRSREFRRSVERATKRARERGLTFEIADHPRGDVDESFERLLAIERRSWKGLGGVGIEAEPMRSFYRDMNRRLASRGKRRLTFGRIDGEDVAYIFGGVFGDTYRGLQFSFDARFEPLSLGNLCQIHEIGRLAEAGLRRYDLGTEVRYKKRWGEGVHATSSLIVHRQT